MENVEKLKWRWSNENIVAFIKQINPTYFEKIDVNSHYVTTSKSSLFFLFYFIIITLSIIYESINLFYCLLGFFVIRIFFGNLIKRLLVSCAGLFRKKNDAYDLYERLYDYINEDFGSSGIDSWVLERISKEIQKATEGIKEYSIEIRQLENKDSFILDFLLFHYRKGLQEIVKQEKENLCIIIDSFNKLVQSWMSHHATELAELEKQIASQELSTQNSGGKAALEISRISLQEHLKELEKVRV